MTAKRKKVLLALLAVVVFVIFSFALENTTGLPSDTTIRIASAAICLWFIFKLRLDYPGERWPTVSLWVAFIVNVGLFFTPLVDRPLSRGELMIFALPDAVVVLVARISTYEVSDVHQRAIRQQMILGLLFAATVCAVLFALTLTGVHTVH